MNNFGKTEALPKTGHVNEVCKEWLVREDGALAYKLQSQEINDFYKGNRFRNAVVREDFPTALHEQIKEQENAERQAEAYRRRLQEQEQHDKRVAKDISEKLERDLREQQQRELMESEMIAQKMQEIYVNLPPVPPPASRDKGRPPPRPAKASTLQQQNPLNEPTASSSGRYHNQHNHPQQQQQHQHQHNQSLQYFDNTNGYVGLSLPTTSMVDIPTTPQRHKSQSSHLLVSDASSSSSPNATTHAFNQFLERRRTQTDQSQQQQQHQQAQHRHQHSSSSLSAGSNASNASSSAARRNVFDFMLPTIAQTPNSINPPHTPHSPHSPSLARLHTPPPTTPKQTKPLQPTVDELIEYSDAVDSLLVRREHEANDSSSLHSPNSHTNINRVLSPSHENLLRNEQKFQKLSPEKYDQLVGNAASFGGAAAAAERLMQQHADDIDVYVDPCDYASLQEIGLPMEEIKEMSKKIKQEQKDELLARRLQELEASDGMSQEERDRLLAIEAQDKELAKMLQDREKAKAKRAKEKARLRKSQQKDASLCSTSNGLHCGPLLALPQDCMSGSKHSTSSSVASAKSHGHASRHEEDVLDLEAYANPIDALHNQRQPNGTLTNGSLTREPVSSASRHVRGVRDDDIYTLPVDNCRPGQRPLSVNLSAESSQHNSMSRSENYALETHDLLNGHDIPPRMNYSKSTSFDPNSHSPTPPYMPIQGTRRSTSSEDRKKKSKDKCTHQ